MYYRSGALVACLPARAHPTMPALILNAASAAAGGGAAPAALVAPVAATAIQTSAAPESLHPLRASGVFLSASVPQDNTTLGTTVVLWGRLHLAKEAAFGARVGVVVGSDASMDEAVKLLPRPMLSGQRV